MGNKGRTDRERLLKLIDGDVRVSKDIQRRKNIKEASRKLRGLPFLLKERTQPFLRRLIKGEIPNSLLNLASFNKILVGILSIMVIYLVSDFISSFLRKEETFYTKRITQNARLPADGQAQRKTQIANLSPLGYYLNQSGGKDIFSPQRIELVKAKDAGLFLSEEPQAELKLVGVDWGGNPVALIEDTRTQKTYFVKKGESIKEFRVMDIFKDRVSLRYGNKVVELK